MKKENGITLIALAVTILVLIILSAITINLSMGEEGIIDEAEKNKGNIINDIEKTRNQLETLKDNTIWENTETNNDDNNIIEVKIPKIENGYYQYSGKSINVEISGYDNENKPYMVQSGITEAKDPGTYTVIWDLKDKEKYKWKDGTTEQKRDTWTIAKIDLKSTTAANYGDRVKYSVTVNGITLGDGKNEDGTLNENDYWRIFYNNGTNVIMIYNDYLPNQTNIAKEKAGLSTKYTYKVYSNYGREDMMTRLGEPSYWTSLLNGNEIDLNGKATAKGAVDLETWVNSWNAKGYENLYIKYFTVADGYSADGYKIGTNKEVLNNNVGLNTDEGYNNTLYFPYKDMHGASNDCSLGYWIDSPSYSNDRSIMFVKYNGDVIDGAPNIYSQIGICPVIYLSSDVNGKFDGETWVLELE